MCDAVSNEFDIVAKQFYSAKSKMNYIDQSGGGRERAKNVLARKIFKYLAVAENAIVQ